MSVCVHLPTSGTCLTAVTAYPLLPVTADDVHRFIVDYVRKAPWPSGIHAKFRWTERYLGHLSNAAVNWTPPINQTDKVLQTKVMKYVRSNPPPPFR
jgi:hypothetical protein